MDASLRADLGCGSLATKQAQQRALAARTSVRVYSGNRCQTHRSPERPGQERWLGQARKRRATDQPPGDSRLTLNRPLTSLPQLESAQPNARVGTASETARKARSLREFWDRSDDAESCVGGSARRARAAPPTQRMATGTDYTAAADRDRHFELGLGRLYPAAGPSSACLPARARQHARPGIAERGAGRPPARALSERSLGAVARPFTATVCSACHPPLGASSRGTEFIGSMDHAAGPRARCTRPTFRSAPRPRACGRSRVLFAWEVAGSANVHLNPNFPHRCRGNRHRIRVRPVELEYRRRARMPGAPWSVWGYATSYTIPARPRTSRSAASNCS